MSMETINLIHLGDVESPVIVTPYGFTELPNIEAYRGKSVRRYVVLRIDILTMALDGVTSYRYIESYRKIFYNILVGSVGSIEILSNALKVVYQNDDVFKLYLGELYYFGREDASLSFAEVIWNDLYSRYRNCMDTFRYYMQAADGKDMYETYGYLYFKVPDKTGKSYFGEGYDVEVISRASNWRGIAKEPQ